MKKACAVCQQEFDVKPCHAPLRRTCSRACMAADYKLRMAGAANPNFRNYQATACEVCGKETPNKTRFCSVTCSNSRPEVTARIIAAGHAGRGVPRKPPRTCSVCWVAAPKGPYALTCATCVLPFRPRPTRPSKANPSRLACAYCAAEYRSYSKKRKFCSYPCFVKSGGPVRAGMEASKMIRKYGAKKDANHNDIARVFSERGIPFYDLSTFGRGLPDGLAWAGEQWRLVEIKNPKTGYGRRGLNPLQLKWLSQGRGGPVFVIKTVEDAERFAEGKFDEVPKEFPDVPEVA